MYPKQEIIHNFFCLSTPIAYIFSRMPTVRPVSTTNRPLFIEKEAGKCYVFCDRFCKNRVGFIVSVADFAEVLRER